MQPNFDNKPDAFIKGYNEWLHCHCNGLAKPDNPYTDQLLDGNRVHYDEWEEGWIEASFGTD